MYTYTRMSCRPDTPFVRFSNGLWMRYNIYTTRYTILNIIFEKQKSNVPIGYTQYTSDTFKTVFEKSWVYTYTRIVSSTLREQKIAIAFVVGNSCLFSEPNQIYIFAMDISLPPKKILSNYDNDGSFRWIYHNIQLNKIIPTIIEKKSYSNTTGIRRPQVLRLENTIFFRTLLCSRRHMPPRNGPSRIRTVI